MVSGKEKEQDKLMEVCDEDEKTHQKPTDTISNKDNVELCEKTFEFVHSVINNKRKKNWRQDGAP